jgi:redox-sensitive bicupin YhaK (pirin superfamily)
LASRNDTAETTRCYILVYPCDPSVPSAKFDAIRTQEMRRSEHDGVTATHVVARGETRLHGDLREWVDASLAEGATDELTVPADEAGVVFVLEGEVAFEGAGEHAELAREHTLLLAPTDAPRTVRLTARARARILRILTGEGFGLELAAD